MIIRLATDTEKDVGAIWSIIEDYKERLGDGLLKDEASITFTELVEAIQENQVVAMTETVNGIPDYPVGGVRFSEQNEDLHIRINLIMRPEYQRIALQQHAFDAIIEWAFRYYKVGKIRARIAEPRTTAISMVKLTKFKDNGLDRNHEYLINGQKVDVLNFELHRPYWERIKKLHNRFATLVGKVASFNDIQFVQALCQMLKLSMKKGYA